MPNNEVYKVPQGTAYENQKFKTRSGSNKCELEIKNADIDDNGVWEWSCNTEEGSRKTPVRISRKVNVVCFEDFLSLLCIVIFMLGFITILRGMPFLPNLALTCIALWLGIVLDVQT